MTSAAALQPPDLSSLSTSAQTSSSNNSDKIDTKDKDKDEEKVSKSDLRYVQYELEKEHVYLDPIRALISKDLSEPYSIYVYRYFLNQWGDLCYMALDADSDDLRGVVVCKLENHRSGTFRGYIAMLATVKEFRGKGIATKLVEMAITSMKERGADEIVLETEVTNEASLRLYERLGFLRSKRLHRYYLNGNTAFRLVLYLKEGAGLKRPIADPLMGPVPGMGESVDAAAASFSKASAV